MTEPARTTTSVEFPDCPLCGSSTTRELLIARDRLLGRPGEFPVVCCTGCGFVFLKPRPTAAALGSFYPDDYYPLDEAPSGEAIAAANDLLKTVSAWVRAQRIDRPRVLDVGCGVGLFLHLAQESGMQVRGIELSGSAVSYARLNFGLDVHHGTLDDAEIPAESCDIVVMWHVLEHLPDPVASLRQVASILAPGGLLLAAVPNLGSLEARIFGRRWYSLDAPRHLNHFSPNTLLRTIERAGLQPQRLVQSTGTAGLVYSLMGDLTGVSLKLRRRLLSDRTYHRIATTLHYLLKPACMLAARLGRGGALELFATKPK